MPSRFQKFVPVFGLGVVLFVAAILFEHGHSVDASDSPSRDRILFNTIVQRVEDEYYKPVDSRMLLDGERSGMLAVIRAHKDPVNMLPVVTATGHASEDNELMDRLLADTTAAYHGRIDASLLAQGAIRGALNSLHDPYTIYLDAQEYTSLEESLSGGNFSGIGVYIVEDPRSGEVLIDPIDDSPALHAGLKPGDVIMAVDGRTVRGMKLDLVEHLIRGKMGTVVALLVKPHGSSGPGHVVRVTRDQIHVPSVHAKIEDDIEYIRLSEFGDDSADEVHRALLDGQRHHVRGYILDLRYNGGGLLETAVEISSFFIPQGPIVSTIDRAGDKDTKSALGTSLDAKPLVLLVNRFSASSSEITAGAIQDYHVGTLIGTKTFGKGVVQSLIPLRAEGAVKITTSRYVTPAGRDIQHKGIQPNIVIDQPDDLRYLDTPRDRQLTAAKALVNSESKK